MNTFNITRHFVVFVAQIYRGLGSVLQTKRLCLDRDNIVSEISKLSTEDKLLLTCTSTIFRSEKESVKTDILSCSQTNKNILAMLNVIPHTWIQGGNSVLTCAINALRHESVKPVPKAVTADHIYANVQPSFVSQMDVCCKYLGILCDM